MVWTFATIGAIAIVLGLVPTGLNAQAPAQPSAKAEQPQPPATAQPAVERPPIPDATKLTLLIQSYVVALSQANLTGNYSVLHTFGAPAFQENNPPDKLFQIFTDMRTQNIDLTPVILYTPILMREPAYDEQGLLHLVGYYKTEPQQVHFDLTLQPVNGMWRLFAISVKTMPLPPLTSANPAAPLASPAARKPTAGKESTAKKAAPKKGPSIGGD